jgi:predicted nucleic-acid-binding Zn-ribbon protein
MTNRRRCINCGAFYNFSIGIFDNSYTKVKFRRTKYNPIEWRLIEHNRENPTLDTLSITNRKIKKRVYGEYFTIRCPNCKYSEFKYFCLKQNCRK